MIDFHCHLDLYADHVELIAECDRLGIRTLAVTTTPSAWPRNRDLAVGSRCVRVALGLHPQLVAERASEMELFERYLSEARYVGEVGLDGGRDGYRSIPLQERVFGRILDLCGHMGGKILSIHSVRAVPRVLALLEEHLQPEQGRAVLHWFAGTRSEAQWAARLGCYFSVNAAMLRSAERRKMIAELPPERLLTETDGPFLRLGGRPARPRDVGLLVEELAALLSLSTDAMSSAIQRNLRALVSFDVAAQGEATDDKDGQSPR